jgi:RNA polymerase sigma-70 factor (ECF subfamily)
VTYASGTANCGGPTRVRASGSRSRRSGRLNKNPRPNVCGPTGRPSHTLVPLPPQDREWEAFQEMFLVARPRFVRMAYTILRNKEDAEDAVQDALLSAYVHLSSFEGRSALTTWFSRIVLNSSFMIRRKWKSSHIGFSLEPSTNDDTAWIEKIPASEPDPEMCYAEGETLEWIDHLLGKMSATLRQAFTMTYFEELSAAEAGAVLGVSVGTFKSRLFRARQHLMNQAQRSLVAPVRQVTQPAFFSGNNDFPALSAKSAELPARETAFPGLSHFNHAPGSGTPNAND